MTDMPSRLQESIAERYRIEREIGRCGMATVFRRSAIAREASRMIDRVLRVMSPAWFLCPQSIVSTNSR